MDSQEDDLTQQDGYTPASLGFGGTVQVASDAAALKQALIDEKGAPELLQYKEDMVTSIEKRLAEQEQLLEDWEGQPDKDFPRSIIQYDLHRVRYLLRGYLRVRLRKLETHVMAILDDPEAAQRMSDKERAYSAQYLRLFFGQMKSSLMDHLPENCRELVQKLSASSWFSDKDMVDRPDLRISKLKNFRELVRESSASAEKDMVDRPDLDRHIFCRILEDCGHVALDRHGTSQEFNRGDLYVVRYGAIRTLLADHAVELI